MTIENNSKRDAHLVTALTRLLRPLIRFLISREFTYVRLIQIIRPLYVDLVVGDFEQQKVTVSDSRISVLTGIARRYVKELRQSDVPADPAMLKSSPGTRLVAEWLTSVRFTDKRKQPLVLDRFADNNASPSFEELANIATSDVRPRTLLDDLAAKNLVKIDQRGRIKLLGTAYKPNKHTTELIDYFGVHMHDHMAATTNNLNSESDPMFDRSAFQDKLTPESVEKLNQYSDQLAMEMLRSVYTRAAELAAGDVERQDNTHRFRIGSYCYHENEARKNDQE